MPIIQIITERALPESFLGKYRDQVTSPGKTGNSVILNGPILYKPADEIKALAAVEEDILTKAILYALAIVQAREQRIKYSGLLKTLSDLCVSHPELGVTHEQLMDAVKQSDLQSVPVAEAQKSPAYWDLMGNAYQLMAIPTLQRAWGKAKGHDKK